MSETREGATAGGEAPAIYVFINGGTAWGDVLGRAISEDGHWLAGHCSSSEGFFRHDMGLTSDWKHDLYKAHYPGGYRLVEVPNAEIMTHPGICAAVAIANQRSARATGEDGTNG